MRNLVLVAILGMLSFATGCSTDPFRKATLPEPGPTGLDEQQFDDVPAPRGFRLDTRRSFSHRSGELRMGSFRYEGTRLTPAEALAHYEREMVRPICGWTLAEIRPEEGRAVFRKGRDEARVLCQQKGEVTRVTVEVNYEDVAPGTQE